MAELKADASRALRISTQVLVKSHAKDLMNDIISVVVLSDTRIFREALSCCLKVDNDIDVLTTSNFAEAAENVCLEDPCVVVVDATSSDAVSIAYSIRAKYPKVNIVVVTSARGDSDFLTWAETGVCGYVDCDSSAADLAAAIRHAAKGEVLYSPRIVALLASRVAKLSSERRRTSELDSLTPREHNVLALMAEGYPNKTIAQRLEIGETTIKNHVHNILEKLGMKNRGLAAAYYLRECMRGGSNARLLERSKRHTLP